MLWEYLREEEFPAMIDRAHGVCAMAIGCVEKHGQHLPLGTDTLKGGKILEMASEREEVCIFPRMYFGDLQGSQACAAGKGEQPEPAEAPRQSAARCASRRLARIRAAPSASLRRSATASA